MRQDITGKFCHKMGSKIWGKVRQYFPTGVESVYKNAHIVLHILTLR